MNHFFFIKLKTINSIFGGGMQGEAMKTTAKTRAEK